MSTTPPNQHSKQNVTQRAAANPCNASKWGVFKAHCAAFGIGGGLWRTTTALDRNPAQPKRGADRDQAVVHALLRTKDQIPKEAPAADLKRKIANKLQEIEPVAARQAGVTDALRIGAVPACVAVMLAVGIHFATTNMSAKTVAKKSDATVAAGDADPVNPGARLKPLSPSELFVPIQPWKEDGKYNPSMKNAAADNAALQSVPVAREANAMQKTVNALQEAINRHLPPMQERPK